MRNKHTRLFQMDDSLRLMFAFYSCIADNPNWMIDGEVAESNRNIAKAIFPDMDIADYYFTLNNKFYTFNVMGVEGETIDCRVEEYDTFYDLTDFHLVMDFSYHVPTKSIVTLKNIERVEEIQEKQYKKVA